MKQNFKMITILLIGIVIGISINIASFAEKGIYAVKSKYTLLINSKPTYFSLYDIEGEQYIDVSDLNVLSLDVQRDSKNKTYNIIPQTYIAFKEIDDKRYIDLEYYISRYFKSAPIPDRVNIGELVAPPVEGFDWSYFFELESEKNKEDLEGCAFHIEDNKAKVIYKGKVKYYKTPYGPKAAINYYDFVKNSNLFFYVISKNESLLEKDK